MYIIYRTTTKKFIVQWFYHRMDQDKFDNKYYNHLQYETKQNAWNQFRDSFCCIKIVNLFIYCKDI